MLEVSDLLRVKNVGIDMFDNCFRAIESKNGIYIDDKVENICSMLSFQSNSKVFTKNEITNEYLIEEETVKMLAKYAYKNLENNILGARLIISLPYDFSICSTNELIKRQIIDSCIKAKWKKIYLIENFICSAVGTGVPSNDLDEDGIALKNLYVYSNSRCTYVGIIFAGGSFNVEVIDKPIEYISINEIEESYNKVIDALPNELPLEFDYFKDVTKMKKEDYKKLQVGWSRSLHNVYFTVPDKKKNEIGTQVLDHTINFCTNYDTCIIDGLNKLISNLIIADKERKIKVPVCLN